MSLTKAHTQLVANDLWLGAALPRVLTCNRVDVQWLKSHLRATGTTCSSYVCIIFSIGWLVHLSIFLSVAASSYDRRLSQTGRFLQLCYFLNAFICWLMSQLEILPSSKKTHLQYKSLIRLAAAVSETWGSPCAIQLSVITPLIFLSWISVKSWTD